MSHFKQDQFKIRDEGKDSSEVRVVKLDTGAGPQVRNFNFTKLDVKETYQAVKSKYGALAATDKDRHAKSSRDSRFSVNPLLREPLAIEDEERRVIETRVQEGVKSLSHEARIAGDKRGYEDGLKKGRDEAYAQFHSEAQTALNSFQSFVENFELMGSEILKANERFLVEMVFRIAKMISLKEISTDPDYILRLARALIERVGVRDNIRIKISPKDSASLESLKSELMKSFSDLKNLNIEVAEDVAGGGCTIETQWSAIDASIETQLKGLEESLLGDKAKGPSSGA
jgi:flagellar assembly protein FliH